MTVKISILDLQNTMTSAKEKYNSLLRASGKLICAVMGEQDFKLPSTFGRLKGIVRTVKTIGMPQMMYNSRYLSATKEPPKNTSS